MAPVPLSVRRSMRTSSAGIRNRLSPARRSASSLSSRVVSRIGSTTLMRKGSMMVFTTKILRMARLVLGREHHVAALPEPDPRVPLALAEAPQDDLVSVLEEGPLLPRGEIDRIRPAARDLEETAHALRAGARDRAARDQVPGPEEAAVRGVVGEHLRGRPVEVPGVAPREDDGREPQLAH